MHLYLPISSMCLFIYVVRAFDKKRRPQISCTPKTLYNIHNKTCIYGYISIRERYISLHDNTHHCTSGMQISENLFRMSPYLDDHTELIDLPALMGSNMLCLGITNSFVATKFSTCSDEVRDFLADLLKQMLVERRLIDDGHLFCTCGLEIHKTNS